MLGGGSIRRYCSGKHCGGMRHNRGGCCVCVVLTVCVECYVYYMEGFSDYEICGKLDIIS